MIGVIGAPYYIFAVVLASVSVKHISFGFLILLPLWLIYDRISQTTYIAYVKNGGCSKSKYTLISITYQFIFICITLVIMGAVET
ncbi:MULTISPECIES: hypothetical protein [Colwelliaceae]|uniref:Uncharacterized protein n=2 Tax=Colwelliaceae TaxID=267889 RepID=A0A4P6P0T2_9GAMM|nr:hypothetical protein [Litorilituus sediminis]QBG34444.1 hypothetical protein EMK97_01175 [Litorilituus sediminis]WNC68606.1 hypothetical protein RI845_00315 [Colwelliaceae bacterium SQ345]